MACMTEISPSYSSFHLSTGLSEKNDGFKYGIMESSCASNSRYTHDTSMAKSSYQNSDNGYIVTAPSDDVNSTPSSYPRRLNLKWTNASKFSSVLYSESMLDSHNGNRCDGVQEDVCMTTFANKEKRNNFPTDVLDGDSGYDSNTSNLSNGSVENAMYPQFKNINARLRSFSECPSVIYQKAQKLSEAGFFLVTFMIQSLARCHSCGIELKNLETIHDPMTEHARCSPSCSYLRAMKGDEFIKSAQRVHKQNSLQENHSHKSSNGTGSSHSKDVEKYPDSTLQKNPLLTDAAQRVIKMGYLPKQVNKAVEEVLKLKDWTTMTPNDIIGKLKEQNVLPAPISNDHPNVLGKFDSSNIASIKEEIRTLKERKLCKVCCEEDVSIVFLPCAHLVCCAQCAPAIQKCAVCRKLVKGTVRVSFSN
ncbi:hypothetical protein FSP39_021663 [Pinctada imbricata]|uniref:RING-type domain-containing protein n=1 Tax=Pinctada imbricata TaxID=66713 RepID=A0AA88YG70_PINIB|nr:hypothetical protein FSP39_021663 [Pinctada imbricata]